MRARKEQEEKQEREKREFVKLRSLEIEMHRK